MGCNLGKSKIDLVIVLSLLVVFFAGFALSEDNSSVNDTLVNDNSNFTLNESLFNESSFGDNSSLNETLVNETNFEENITEDFNETFEENVTSNETLDVDFNKSVDLNETFSSNETLYLNRTLELNRTSQNITERHEGRIVINQNRRVIRNVILNESKSNIEIELPGNATNITINKIVDIGSGLKGEILIERDKIKVNESGTLSQASPNLITGAFISAEEPQLVFVSMWYYISYYAKEIFFGLRDSITGFAVAGDNETVSENLTLVIEDEVEEINIEYDLPGPSAIEEENIIDGEIVSKTLTISSDEHLENVLSYMEVPEKEVGLHLFHVIPLCESVNFTSNETILGECSGNDSAFYNRWDETSYSSYDLDSNGLIDYIEWDVSLSTQIYTALWYDDRVYNASRAVINNTIGSAWVINEDSSAIYYSNDTLLCRAGAISGEGGNVVYTWYVNGSKVKTEVSKNLVLEMNFEDGEGELAIDSSGKGNNGDLEPDGASSRPTWTPNGKIGGAYVFDGNDDHIRVADDDSIDISEKNSFSAFAWVKFNELPPSSWPSNDLHILNKGYATTTGYFLRYDWAQGVFEAKIEDSNGQIIGNNNVNGIQGSTIAQKDEWYYVGFTFDRNTNTTILYVNGIEENKTVDNDISDCSNTAYLTIGAYSMPGPAISAIVNGTIDEVKIYDKALTEDEIFNEYRFGSHYLESEYFQKGDEVTCAATFDYGLVSLFDFEDSRKNVLDILNVNNGTCNDKNYQSINCNYSLSNNKGARYNALKTGDIYVNTSSEGLNIKEGSFSLWISPDDNWNNYKNYTILSIPSEVGLDGNQVLNMNFNNNSLYENYVGDENIVNDYSVSNNSGLTKSGIVSDYTSNLFDGVFSFENGYVLVSDDESLRFNSTPFSYEMWVKSNGALNPSSNIFIFDKTSAANEQMLKIVASNTDGYIEASLGNASANSLLTDGTTKISDGKWHHIVLSYDGDGYLYVDGELIQKALNTVGNFTENQDLYIGASRTGTGNWNGLIDNFVIYNKSLSLEEVRGNYLGGISLHKGMDNSLYLRLGNETLSYDLTNFDNEWHHFAGSYGESGVRLYVDSILINSSSSNVSVGNFGNEIYIGSCLNVTKWNAYVALDSLALYSREFGDEEVYTLFERGVSGYSQDRLHVNTLESDFNLSFNYNLAVSSNISILDKSLLTGNLTSEVFDFDYKFSNGSLLSYIPEYNYWEGDYKDDSLVLDLRFDNDTKDYSGNGNDGIMVEETNCTSMTNGRIYGGCEFEGVNDYVSIPTLSNPSLNWTSMQMLTFSAWVYPKSFNFGSEPEGYIIEQGKIGIGFGIKNSTGNLFVEGYDTGFGYTLTDNSINCNVAPDLNEWNYLVFTYDGSNFELYKNGGLLCTDGTSGTFSYRNGLTYPLTIGFGSSASRYFNGTIDEVRVWNRSLTSDEIYEEYQRGVNKLEIQTRTGDYYNPPDNSRIVSLNFDGPGMEVNSQVGCILEKDKGQNFTEGIIGSGALFNNDYNLTAYCNLTQNNLRIESFALWTRNATTNEWKYIVNNTDTLYVNGENKSDYEIPLTIERVAVAGNLGDTIIRIGTNFTGKIDEVVLYDRQLSENEIKYLYKKHQDWSDWSGYDYTRDCGDSCISALGFWEMKGNKTIDNSKFNNNIYLYGTEWTYQGKHGSAINLDSNEEDYVDIDLNNMDFDYNTSGLAIESWIKTTDDGTIMTTSDGRVKLSISSGLINFESYETSSETLTGKTTITDNKWHHIMGSISQTEGKKIFVDGILDNHDNSIKGASGTTNQILIGVDESNANYFNGTIDSFKMYNTSFTYIEAYKHGQDTYYNSSGLKMPKPNQYVNYRVKFSSINETLSPLLKSISFLQEDYFTLIRNQPASSPSTTMINNSLTADNKTTLTFFEGDDVDFNYMDYLQDDMQYYVSFDDKYRNSSSVIDSKSGTQGTFYGNVSCNQTGKSGTGCDFDGTGGYVELKVG